MEVTQLKSFINEVQSIALGDNALPMVSGETLDTSDLTSLGEVVLESDTNKDKFYDTLLDRVGKTWVKYRVYTAKSKDNIIRNKLEFGCILQKIQTMKIAAAEDNDSWKDSHTMGSGKDTTDITQLLFSKIGTWAIKEKVIYDYQLKSAFTSWAEMGSFVELVFADMRNALEFELEQCIKLTRATCIAQAFKGIGTLTARNVLMEYNSKVAVGSVITDIASALMNKDFIKFANAEILKVVKRVQSMKSLYNSAGADRFTPIDSMVVEIATDYASASATYLESDTFHKELISLPSYDEIDEWLSGGTDNSSTMSIAITDESETEVIKDCIIGCVRDIDACGVMVDNVRTKSQYDALAERTVYSHKADWGSFVDGSENCVVFYLEYVEPTLYDLTITDGANTTVSVTRNGKTVTEGTDVLKEGDVITVNASASDGYTLTTFTINGERAESGDRVTVTSDVIIVTEATADES